MRTMTVDELRKSLVGVPGHLRVVTQGDLLGSYPSATDAEVVDAERYQKHFIPAGSLCGGLKARVFLIRL